MKMNFQQGTASKRWVADVKSKKNIITDLRFNARLEGVTWAGKDPKVSYEGTKVVLTFGKPVTGQAEFTVVKGRTLGYQVFGGTV